MWRWLLLDRLEQVSARCSGKLGDRTGEQHKLREGRLPNVFLDYDRALNAWGR